MKFGEVSLSREHEEVVTLTIEHESIRLRC